MQISSYFVAFSEYMNFIRTWRKSHTELTLIFSPSFTIIKVSHLNLKKREIGVQGLKKIGNPLLPIIEPEIESRKEDFKRFFLLLWGK